MTVSEIPYRVASSSGVREQGCADEDQKQITLLMSDTTLLLQVSTYFLFVKVKLAP
jgi:hypothetical protein